MVMAPPASEFDRVPRVGPEFFKPPHAEPGPRATGYNVPSFSRACLCLLH